MVGASESGQNPLIKGLITGPAVVAEMLTGGLFMENMKMEKQRTGLAYPKLIRPVLAQGIKGWTAGFMPWGFTLAMTKGAAVGYFRAASLSFLEPRMANKKNADMLSGFMAGAGQGVVMSPILLARTRVNQSLTERAAKGAVKGSVMDEFRMSGQIMNSAIRSEGISVLLTGMPMFVFKRAYDWGTRFIFIGMMKDYLKQRHPGKPLGDMENLFAAVFGGAFSVCFTQPIDRIMPIIQASGSEYGGFLSFFKKSIAEQGISTIWRGAAMRMVHCGWHTGFAIFIANKAYESMGIKK